MTKSESPVPGAPGAPGAPEAAEAAEAPEERKHKDKRRKEPKRDEERSKRRRRDDERDNRDNRDERRYELGSRYYGDKHDQENRDDRDDGAEKRYRVGSRYYAEDSKDKDKKERKPKTDSALMTKTGGAYIPPARLRMMRAEITDKSSAAYQRLSWEALKKSIHGYINKINTGNIALIIKELLRENIVRGRGLLCRSVIQAQAASPTFTHIYAALAAAINSRFPNIGELLLKRLVLQFKRGFKRNDKAACISAVTFVAHLVNQRVAHEILALETLTLLVESPTNDSVEVAIAFLKECGQKLTEVSSKGVNAIFEMLRNILHEGQLDKRVQYMIEVMFQIRKDGFKDHPAIQEELELVPEEEQFTHLIMLDEATDPQDLLNVFKFDENYEGNEGKYKELCKEILGSDAESNSEQESGTEEDGSEDDSDEENQENKQKEGVIIDNTETNLIALRRTIYLTIHSSLDFEECAHKLMKMQLKPGQEMELCHMFLDCCAEQRTYEKFYGLLAQRFCQINKIYVGPFEQIFKDSYGTAHRLDTNRLRNVSKFFAHLLFTDAISWEALDCIKLNEEDTTSSSRIFVKILFQELAEYMGLGKLNERLKDGTLQEAFSGLFPRDNPKNTRFAINFFTSIGLGGLTDELRDHLKQVPKPQATQANKKDAESSSSSSSDSSSSSSSSSSSDSSDSSSSDSEDSSDSSDSNGSAKKKQHKKRQNSKQSMKEKARRSQSKDKITRKRHQSEERSKRNNEQSSRHEKENARYEKYDKMRKSKNDSYEKVDRERKSKNDNCERDGRSKISETDDRKNRYEKVERNKVYHSKRYENDRDSLREKKKSKHRDEVRNQSQDRDKNEGREKRDRGKKQTQR